ncbi:DUF4176 domain-containing protein [Staphylococcus caledonicus]|uniref:DUF4176 domain-containing protein n=1 Tax=Staphylococcus caledonicus TaxID=2741333 RepID=UPI0018E42164|nr:DUF4176 domain-containing protein [Staphylococcus caledonicus]MBI5972871.1 DUF4176 domain-containing protein [Staphylococcus caledonicus]
METIGSIIYLKDGSQKLMIINRGPIVEIDNQQYMFDYAACKYPIGAVEDQLYYFNEENIDKVIFNGYSDQDEIRFQELFEEMKDSLDSNIQRGVIKQQDNFDLI